MKKVILSCVIFICGIANSQVLTPKASPLAKVQQRVGLTDITISYSRPSVNNRMIFGGLIPFGEKWDEQKVVLILRSGLEKPRMTVENLTIGIEKMEFNSAELVISWEEMNIRFPFTVNTKEKVIASINKTMASETIAADDYYKSASYYYTEQLDMKQALSWAEKAVAEKGPSAYWVSRLLAQIKAANGDFKGAIETAKISLAEAEKDGDQNYVKMNQQSIEEWSKKK